MLTFRQYVLEEQKPRRSRLLPTLPGLPSLASELTKQRAKLRQADNKPSAKGVEPAEDRIYVSVPKVQPTIKKIRQSDKAKPIKYGAVSLQKTFSAEKKHPLPS